MRAASNPRDLRRFRTLGAVFGDDLVSAEPITTTAAKPDAYQFSPLVLARPKFDARVVETLSEPGKWERIRVGVFQDDRQVGEYERNYSLLRTFFPFLSGDQWLALYSPHYTCTRIMELPSCRDIGGESPDGVGFCPVEYYVPAFSAHTFKGEAGVYHLPSDGLEIETIHGYAPFGFISGCHWGDDCSWKVQYLDLSRAAYGIVEREERFGYLELPAGVLLKDAVDLEASDAGVVSIAARMAFSLKDGRRLNQ